jgi:MarR family transcriptional regulator, negative regulator of the multidrug operon emrRAB
MKRADLFKFMNKINDPSRDYGKILSSVHYTHYFLMDRYKKLLADYGLTSIQSNVLGIIDHFHPKVISLEEISEMVLEPNSDVSRTVTRLVEKGFAAKMVNPDNRRKVSIGITPKGVKTIQKIEKDGKFKIFTSRLSKAESQALVNALAKLRLPE